MGAPDNAADPAQVSAARKTERLKREDELNDLRLTFGTPHGIRVLDRILTKCKTFESIWSQSALIHYASGQQDIGHWMMAESIDADENILFSLMTNKKREKKNG